MTLRAPFIVLSALLLCGCGASLPNTTGSLFGGAAATAAPPPPLNDPTARALQVGTTAARAQKCGFNFDPVKLRTQFLAAESTLLGNPAEAEKLGQIYDTAYRGVGKAVADQGEAYCSAQKTAKIKLALNRHLAGDYTPAPPEPVEEEAGFFGTTSSTPYSTPDKPIFHPADDQ
ncbi:MAG: hypothetical protein ACKVP4_06600 [Hyphomicrobium sp.]